MANQEHRLVFDQGVEIWNKWRQAGFEEARKERSQYLIGDLSGIECKNRDLRNIDLSHCDLSRSNLSGSSLINAQLDAVQLSWANLSKVDFQGSEINNCAFCHANLKGSWFTLASVWDSDFTEADLRKTGNELSEFGACVFDSTDFTGSLFGGAYFLHLDLSSAIGLELVDHNAPSTIDVETLFLSKGKIPDIFLQGVGIPLILREYLPSLITPAINYFTCFISYSSKDLPFANKLYKDLQKAGVLCWFDREDLGIGAKFRSHIENAIRRYDKFILVLSKNSLESEWVEYEVEAMLDRQKKEKRNMIFPIRLDRGISTSSLSWASFIHRTYTIGNFEGWRNPEKYEQSFKNLVTSLQKKEQN